MFNKTLPDLQKTVTAMTTAIRDLPSILRRIEEIEKKIAVFLEKEKSLKAADACLVQMASRKITDACSARGIILEPAPAKNPVLFWDRFNFSTLHTQGDFTLALTLQGTLPDYCTNVVENNMSDYQHRIYALSEKESRISKKRIQLSKDALTFSAQVEQRPTEITCCAR